MIVPNTWSLNTWIQILKFWCRILLAFLQLCSLLSHLIVNPRSPSSLKAFILQNKSVTDSEKDLLAWLELTKSMVLGATERHSHAFISENSLDVSNTNFRNQSLPVSTLLCLYRLKGKFLGIWDLCSLTRVNSAPPALGTQSPNQSTAREVLERDTPEYKNIGMKL